MVVKMMRWRPWPPLVTRKYEVKLMVRRLEFEGCCDQVGSVGSEEGGEAMSSPSPSPVPSRFMAEIRWKGQKVAFSSLRRRVKRNFTKEEGLKENGAVIWDQEFQNVCSLSNYKDNVFHPWEITFTVWNGLNQSSKTKIPAIGTASLNLAEFASAAEGNDFELNIPLTLPGSGSEPCPTLCVALSLLEMRTAQELLGSARRSVVPVSSPIQSGETVSSEKGELSAIKAGLRKVKIFREYVSARRANKPCLEEEGSEGRCSNRSEDGEYTYPFDSDSLDDFEEGESDERKEDSNFRKSFTYGTLAYANCTGVSFYSSLGINSEDEDQVYYSNRKSDVGCSRMEDSTASIPEPSLLQSSKLSILSWRKRKLSFRSPKAKGEPLLKKAYGEEGGDDIDFDRRQLSSDESLPFGRHKPDEDSTANRSSISEFGDDSFAIGSWEQKEVISRDGQMKLQSQVFFSSIDQMSEQAAGESACTALVAVIADWFQANRDVMPIKSQFDSLIHEGSLEWRNLCENETYKERFPDKHFDLETILQAKIRHLSVDPGKSFIGFFHPDGMVERRFDFLQGAMSFDSIWEEISHAAAECPCNDEPQVYIVSWNDHFFVLKVEREAYYIIDTLGERLYEGCNHAYILKFDRNTTIHKLRSATQSSEVKPVEANQMVTASVKELKDQQNQQINPKDGVTAGKIVTNPEKSMKNEEELEVVCQGKESCKEYIKSFLAAIPIRELLVDIKKGLMASTPLHHRLQIEFNYTQFSEPQYSVTPATESTAAMKL